MSNSKTLLYSLVVVGLAYFYYQANSGPSIRKGTVVETKSGQVRGIISVSRDGREYSSWLKIPYAKPPLDELRFKSPQPIGKWKGIVDGSKYGDKCAQLELFSWNFVGSEDCLFVNVHVPKVDKPGKLPVMVYIHGGGFFGMGVDDYTPEYLMDEDIILVTLSYRLSVLGFLSAGDKDIRGNMGLKDQVLALKWIKDNIESFNGDSNKITIFGESAGGASVHYMMLAEKKTRGLFNKAISMSGTSMTPWGYRDTNKIVEKSKLIASKLNCPNGTGKEMAECLQKVDVRNLFEAVVSDMKRLNIMYVSSTQDFLTAVVEAVDDDEAFLTQSPYEIMSQGKASKVPWLTGVCANEGLLQSLAFYTAPEALEVMEKNFNHIVGRNFYLDSVHPKEKVDEAAGALRNFYFKEKSSTLDETIEKYTRLFSDALFIIGSNEAASVQRKYSDVYLYLYDRPGGPSMTTLLAEFQWRYPFIVELLIFLGNSLYNQHILGQTPKDYGHSGHAQDLPMLFPMPTLFPTKVAYDPNNIDYKFSKDMTKLWTSFAKDESNLEFRCTKVPKVAKEGPMKYFKLDEKPEIVVDPFKQPADVWRSINFNKIYSKK